MMIESKEENVAEEIKIIALGGFGENGKNMIAVEINNQIFVLDAGIKYPSRSTPGIEYAIANYDFLKENKDKIKAYIISHGHYYHFAAISYIINDCPAPIYCTEVTRFFIEYFIKKNNIEVNNIKFFSVKSDDKIKISDVNFTFFPICHSVSGSLGVAIETCLGNIVYVNEFIIENNNLNNFNMYSQTLFELAKQKTLLLMSSSLYAFRQGYTSPQNRLTPLVEGLFDNQRRIIVALSIENIYGLLEIIRLAILCDYKLYAYDKETYFFWEQFKNIQGNNVPNGIVLRRDINNSDNKSLLIMLGDEREIYEKLSILYLSSKKYFDFLSVKSVFILAFSTDKNNELPHNELLNNLYKINIDIVDISKKYLEMVPSKEDLQNVLYLFKPQYYLPISGSFLLLTSNAQLAFQTGFLTHRNIFILENGLGIKITTKNIDFFKVKYGAILIENGKKIDSNIIDERIAMSNGGVIVVTVVIDKKQKKIVSKPEISMVGCGNFYNNLQSINDEVIKVVNDCFSENNNNISESLYFALKRKMFKNENVSIIFPIVIEDK